MQLLGDIRIRGMIAALLIVLPMASVRADMQKSVLSINPMVIHGGGAGGGQSSGSLTIIDEREAREKLAKKLDLVNKGPDMKVATDPKSASGGKSFNANDGNSFMSNTTYHSYVWSYCLNWTDGSEKNCQKWLDPYVSIHGTDGDRSPLEETVMNAWNSMKKEGEQGEGGRYAIWNIQAKGKSVIDPETGTLDMSALNRMELVDDLKQKVEKVGYETANRQISVTYDENAGKAEGTMPNIESLRLMASRWTDMMRRRLISIRGESLAAQKGVEFMLGEDIESCKAYMYAVKNNPTQDTEEQDKRMRPQGPLSMDTKNLEIEDRAKRCQMMMMASVYKPQQGEDRVDAWRARVNAAAIDYAGIDPNSIPRPEGTQLTQEETTQEIAEWSAGGQEMNVVRQPNSKDLQDYNRQLAEAQAGMKEAVERSSFIPDASGQITQYQLKVGQKSLVEINGLTPEMRNELKDTSASKIVSVQNTRDLPQAPSQLTITPK